MLAHTDPRLVRLYRPLVTSFLENDQFSGFAGSVVPSKSTIAPSLESFGLTCATVEGDCGEVFSGGGNSVLQIMIIIEVYSLHKISEVPAVTSIITRVLKSHSWRDDRQVVGSMVRPQSKANNT